MNKPVIAITARMTELRYDVNQDYVDALKNAGARCVLLLPQSKEELSTLLSFVDGICLPGGYDVDPSYYHQPNLHSELIEAQIDRLDLDVIEIAQEKKIPIFGICRGLQIINVALGGSLIQDIPKDILDHNISFKNKTKEIEVNSYHHQAIDRLADGLTICAVSSDGIIEAIEGENILAVQWHPERMTQDGVFNILDLWISTIIQK
jgi:putative glutamine amidotransferase